METYYFQTKIELEKIDNYYKALYSSNFLTRIKLDKTFKYLDLLKKRHIIDEVLDHEYHTNLAVKYSEALQDISNYLKSIKEDQELRRKELTEPIKHKSVHINPLEDQFSRLRDINREKHQEHKTSNKEKENQLKFIVKEFDDYVKDKLPEKMKQDFINQSNNVLSENKMGSRYQYIQRLIQLEQVNPADVKNLASYVKPTFQKKKK